MTDLSARLSARVRLANGNFMQLDLDDEFLPQLQVLQQKGYSGKQIVESLIAADWETLPQLVEVFGRSNGKAVYICLQY